MTSSYVDDEKSKVRSWACAMLSDPVQIPEPSFNLHIHSPLTSSFPQKTQRIEPGLET